MNTSEDDITTSPHLHVSMEEDQNPGDVGEGSNTDKIKNDQALLIEENTHVDEGKWKKFFNVAKVESVEMFRIGWPLAVTFVSLMGMQFVDMIFLGNLGKKEYLAGAALSTAFGYCVLYPVFGTTAAQETLVSQAKGLGNVFVMRVVFVRSIIISSILCIPITLLFSFSGEIFTLLVKKEEESAGLVVQYARSYTLLLIPGIWPFVMFRVLLSFMTSQNIVYPPMIVGVASNLVNILLNVLLVVGVGYQGLGFDGAAIATCISRWITILLLGGYMYYNKGDITIKQVKEICREALKWRGLLEYIKLAIPGGLMLAFEVWGFEITSILSSLMGSVALAAHAALINTTALTFMIPLSISTSTGVRIGQRLGSNDPSGAKQTCWMAVLFATVFMSINACSLVVFRFYIARLFTDDEQVIQVVGKNAYIAALFQLFDGVQVTLGGALRGIGKQSIGAAMTFVSYYVVGIPIGCLCGFYFKWGLVGLWFGLLMGLSTIAIILLCYVVFLVSWEREAVSATNRITMQGEQEQTEEVAQEIELN
ncbi:sodium-driven multidrug efflux pump [Acrasis kona]|uniref:Sodium-driven multidrug efflux pump n=1 Tax=Acrasis kona TaxID=1008807 RepID=A0AAW2ZE52_9EUKA